MIARIAILLILIIVLPDAYFCFRRRKRQVNDTWPAKLLRWMPVVVMTLATIALSLERNFIPNELTWLNLYLLVLGLWFVPRFVYAVCLALGTWWRKRRGKRKNWGKLVGFILAAFLVYITIYGSFVGPKQLRVEHIDLAFGDELPASFNGYKLVLFSDIHLGSTNKQFVERVVDSINAQRADVVVFAGDLQNMQPQEIYPYGELLSSIKARDGVFSVLGNHDYSHYLTGEDEAIKAANEKETVARERQAGWTVLLNENRKVVRSGGDYIIFAGAENDYERPKQRHVDLAKTVEGISDSAFVVMLQHNPWAWEESILPKTTAQLTLSGHTHGGQMRLFGLSGTHIMKTKDRGLYEQDGRYLYVTSGLGGVVPFRFGVKPEIVVITLYKTPQQ